MDKTKRIAVYLRVSTQDQSCELQRREIEDCLKARGWEIHKVYEDKATGTNGNRPQLIELLKDARGRKIDLIIVWKLDRLFRSLKNLVTTLQDLQDIGVDFISLKEQIDMTSAAGRLLTHLLAAFAEFEADIIKDRVRSGLANAKAKGKRLGRPIRRDDTAIQALRAKGMSIRQIAKTLNISKGSVQRALAECTENQSASETRKRLARI